MAPTATDSEVFESASSPVGTAEAPSADQIEQLQNEHAATVRPEATVAPTKAKKYAEMWTEEKTARARAWPLAAPRGRPAALISRSILPSARARSCR